MSDAGFWTSDIITAPPEADKKRDETRALAKQLDADAKKMSKDHDIPLEMMQRVAEAVKTRTVATPESTPPVEEECLSDQLIKFATLLKVPEGAHVGKPFRLRDFQVRIVRKFDNPTMRRLIITMPRKNGKTAFVAFLVLAALIGPLVRRNGQVYSAARSREQAGIVFRLCSLMIRQSRFLSGRIQIVEARKELRCITTGVIYRALSAEAKTAHGLSPFMVIHDEIGQVRGKTDPLYDALETAGGAQVSFLSVVCSTQAPDDGALLSEMIDDAKKNPDDPATSLIFFGAEPDDDPYDPTTWFKANPALDDFRSLEELQEFATRAKRLPSVESTFLNLYLNRRIAERNVYLSPSVWGECAGPIDEDLFESEPVFGGLDLSQTTALTALVLDVTHPVTRQHHLKSYFFMPEETVSDREETDRVPYAAWARAGYIHLVPGRIVDLDWVAVFISELRKRFHISEIRYDRWRIEEFKAALDRIGCRIELVPHGQGFANMAPSLDRFERLAVEGALVHGSNPVLTYCFSNVTVIRDPAGNRKLDRSSGTARIDGAIAAIMSTAIIDAETMDGGRTIYHTRTRPSGVMVLASRVQAGEAEGRRSARFLGTRPAPSNPDDWRRMSEDPFSGLDGDDE